MLTARVVHDDDDIRPLVALVATCAGSEPRGAANGVDAGRLLADGARPDVIMIAGARSTDQEAGIGSGADADVVMPFRPSQLMGPAAVLAPAVLTCTTTPCRESARGTTWMG